MNNSFYLDSLNRQREKIDEMIRNYQQPAPVNNYINTSQILPDDMVLWRVLNENEEVDNLYVQTKTLFINDENMILKGVDGSLQKWKITKIYPVDKKDEKISQLEEEIRKLKEKINNEYTEPTKSIRYGNKSNGVNDVDVESEPKTNGKRISKQE